MIETQNNYRTAEGANRNMQIGQVIREYRKARNLTQEKMASYLGVTAPAVNKWESGSTMPDILLLAPIARLLDISLDVLLSFHETLTTQEVNNIVSEASEKLKNETYEEAYSWAKGKVEQYPNCDTLTWQIAVLLDSARMEYEVAHQEKYDDFIVECYLSALDSKDEPLRNSAADSLFHYYFRLDQFEKAEQYLCYLSEQNPEKKRKQALIYSKTNRTAEAYRTYEELLYSGYQMLNMVFSGIYMLAMEEGNMEKARYTVEKQGALAALFEMGRYHEVASALDLATAQKDEQVTIDTVEQMLASLDTICDFTKSTLYEHMDFRDVSEGYIKELRENLTACFQNEDAYGYLKENQRWRQIMQEHAVE